MGNTELAKRMLGKLVNCVAGARSCTCGSALATAIITQPDAIPDVAKQALKPIIGKYIS
jgi:5'-methylthioadenosine phosphorylase